jgi:hypothetical protein
MVIIVDEVANDPIDVSAPPLHPSKPRAELVVTRARDHDRNRRQVTEAQYLRFCLPRPRRPADLSHSSGTASMSVQLSGACIA